jgi:hypothetical protein
LRFASKYLRTFAAAACISVLSAAAHAETVRLGAMLSGATEVPAKDSQGTGRVMVMLDTETHMMTYTIMYSGLSGPVTAAHFHGPAAVGANAGPVVPITAPYDAPIKGTATLTPDQQKDLLAGMWYFNLHTAANPGGEVRGQLMVRTGGGRGAGAGAPPAQ